MTPEWIQPNTVTTKTAGNPSPSTIRNLGLRKEFSKAEPIEINGVEMFEHGQDQNNENQLENGTKPTNLTDKGKKYAEDMGNWVFENNKTKIFHSGIKRAHDTAKIAADTANKEGANNVTIEANPLLKTLDIGNYEGKDLGKIGRAHV